jgi:hypothetical protein
MDVCSARLLVWPAAASVVLTLRQARSFISESTQPHAIMSHVPMVSISTRSLHRIYVWLVTQCVHNAPRQQQTVPSVQERLVKSPSSIGQLQPVWRAVTQAVTVSSLPSLTQPTSVGHVLTDVLRVLPAVTTAVWLVQTIAMAKSCINGQTRLYVTLTVP